MLLLKTIRFANCNLLRCERPHFAGRKAVFHDAKDGLSYFKYLPPYYYNVVKIICFSLKFTPPHSVRMRIFVGKYVFVIFKNGLL